MVRTEIMENLIKFRKIKEDYDREIGAANLSSSIDRIDCETIIRDVYGYSICKNVKLNKSRKEKIVELALLLAKEQVEEDLKLAEDDFKKELLDNVQL